MVGIGSVGRGGRMIELRIASRQRLLTDVTTTVEDQIKRSLSCCNASNHCIRHSCSSCCGLDVLDLAEPRAWQLRPVPGLYQDIQAVLLRRRRASCFSKQLDAIE